MTLSFVLFVISWFLLDSHWIPPPGLIIKKG